MLNYFDLTAMSPIIEAGAPPPATCNCRVVSLVTADLLVKQYIHRNLTPDAGFRQPLP